MMCKAFAYGYECTWEQRGRTCRHVHSQEVKNTYDLYISCLDNQAKFTSKMRNECLDPKKKLNEIQMEVMITLFEKYPTEPKGQELARFE